MDNLLLNLSFEPAAKKEPPVQKKHVSSHNRRDKPGPNSRPQRNHSNNGRPFKRQADDGSHQRGAPPGSTVKRQKQDRDKNTFVSSLFSSNPAEEEADAQPQDDIIRGEASNAPVEEGSFESLGLDSALCEHLTQKMELRKPTLIQRRAVPPLTTESRDLFVQAQTGSGKTLSYVLPLVQRLMTAKPEINRESGLFAIILAPTRELSNQIYAVLTSVLRVCHRIVPGVVIGGEKKKSEKARIRKGINILVATPGRLADHFDNTESLDLSELRYLILDEGDRLMELGFEETIQKILSTIAQRSRIPESRYSGLPNRRVNVLCSATMKNDVKKLGELSLTNANWVGVTKGEENDSTEKDDTVDYFAPAQLIQESIVVPAKLRLVTLAGILMNIAKFQKGARVMVFLSCSDSVDFHYKIFEGSKTLDDGDDRKLPTVSKSNVLSNCIVHKLHGSLDQQTRTNTLNAYSKNQSVSETLVLFCTDVASRGLDLPYISHVVEYDPPFAADDHVHRIGRTARAGKEGLSVLFLLPGHEESYLDVIAPHHPNGIQKREYQYYLSRAFGSSWESDATTWHLNNERWLLEDSSMLSLGKRAFSKHIGAYATHLGSEREIFSVRNLHLGHIAKSFALRETPGNMSHLGKQKPSTSSKPPKRTKSKKDFVPAIDTGLAQKKMMQMASKHANAMNEFNIG